MANLNVELNRKEHNDSIRRLAMLKDELKNKAVGSGLTRVAGPIKKTMQSLAGEQTGELKGAINQRRISARAARRLELFGDTVSLNPGEVAILIGPNKKTPGFPRAAVSNFLEFGTKPHMIRPRRRGGVLNLRQQGFRRVVRHPGIRPTRFMQRSLEQNRDQIEDLFYEGVNRRIGKLL